MEIFDFSIRQKLKKLIWKIIEESNGMEYNDKMEMIKSNMDKLNQTLENLNSESLMNVMLHLKDQLKIMFDKSETLISVPYYLNILTFTVQYYISTEYQNKGNLKSESIRWLLKVFEMTMKKPYDKYQNTFIEIISRSSILNYLCRFIFFEQIFIFKSNFGFYNYKEETMFRLLQTLLVLSIDKQQSQDKQIFIRSIIYSHDRIDNSDQPHNDHTLSNSHNFGNNHTHYPSLDRASHSQEHKYQTQPVNTNQVINHNGIEMINTNNTISNNFNNTINNNSYNTINNTINNILNNENIISDEVMNNKGILVNNEIKRKESKENKIENEKSNENVMCNQLNDESLNEISTDEYFPLEIYAFALKIRKEMKDKNILKKFMKILIKYIRVKNKERIQFFYSFIKNYSHLLIEDESRVLIQEFINIVSYDKSFDVKTLQLIIKLLNIIRYDSVESTVRFFYEKINTFKIQNDIAQSLFEVLQDVDIHCLRHTDVDFDKFDCSFNASNYDIKHTIMRFDGQFYYDFDSQSDSHHQSQSDYIIQNNISSHHQNYQKNFDHHSSVDNNTNLHGNKNNKEYIELHNNINTDCNGNVQKDINTHIENKNINIRINNQLNDELKNEMKEKSNSKMKKLKKSREISNRIKIIEYIMLSFDNCKFNNKKIFLVQFMKYLKSLSSTSIKASLLVYFLKKIIFNPPTDLFYETAELIFYIKLKFKTDKNDRLNEIVITRFFELISLKRLRYALLNSLLSWLFYLKLFIIRNPLEALLLIPYYTLFLLQYFKNIPSSMFYNQLSQMFQLLFQFRNTPFIEIEFSKTDCHDFDFNNSKDINDLIDYYIKHPNFTSVVFMNTSDLTKHQCFDSYFHFYFILMNNMSNDNDFHLLEIHLFGLLENEYIRDSHHDILFHVFDILFFFSHFSLPSNFFLLSIDNVISIYKDKILSNGQKTPFYKDKHHVLKDFYYTQFELNPHSLQDSTVTESSGVSTLNSNKNNHHDLLLDSNQHNSSKLNFKSQPNFEETIDKNTIGFDKINSRLKSNYKIQNDETRNEINKNNVSAINQLNHNLSDKSNQWVKEESSSKFNKTDLFKETSRNSKINQKTQKDKDRQIPYYGTPTINEKLKNPQSVYMINEKIQSDNIYNDKDKMLLIKDKIAGEDKLDFKKMNLILKHLLVLVKFQQIGNDFMSDDNSKFLNFYFNQSYVMFKRIICLINSNSDFNSKIQHCDDFKFNSDSLCYLNNDCLFVQMAFDQRLFNVLDLFSQQILNFKFDYLISFDHRFTPHHNYLKDKNTNNSFFKNEHTNNLLINNEDLNNKYINDELTNRNCLNDEGTIKDSIKNEFANKNYIINEDKNNQNEINEDKNNLSVNEKQKNNETNKNKEIENTTIECENIKNNTDNKNTNLKSIIDQHINNHPMNIESKIKETQNLGITKINKNYKNTTIKQTNNKNTKNITINNTGSMNIDTYNEEYITCDDINNDFHSTNANAIQDNNENKNNLTCDEDIKDNENSHHKNNDDNYNSNRIDKTIISDVKKHQSNTNINLNFDCFEKPKSILESQINLHQNTNNFYKNNQSETEFDKINLLFAQHDNNNVEFKDCNQPIQFDSQVLFPEISNTKFNNLKNEKTERIEEEKIKKKAIENEIDRLIIDHYFSKTFSNRLISESTKQIQLNPMNKSIISHIQSSEYKNIYKFGVLYVGSKCKNWIDVYEESQAIVDQDYIDFINQLSSITTKDHKSLLFESLFDLFKFYVGTHFDNNHNPVGHKHTSDSLKNIGIDKSKDDNNTGFDKSNDKIDKSIKIIDENRTTDEIESKPSNKLNTGYNFNDNPLNKNESIFEKRRYIGNSQILILFSDENTDPFKIENLMTEFNVFSIWIINCDNGFYRIKLNSTLNEKLTFFQTEEILYPKHDVVKVLLFYCFKYGKYVYELIIHDKSYHDSKHEFFSYTLWDRHNTFNKFYSQN